MNRPDNLTVWRRCGKLLVSQYGGVIGVKGRLLKPQKQRFSHRRNPSLWYFAVGYRRDSKVAHTHIHHLVAECFISRKRRFAGYVCDHKDNNREDNSIFNLQAVSRSYNSRKGNRTIIQTKLHYYVRNNDSALG